MGWPCRLADPALSGVRVFRLQAPFTKYLVFYHPGPGSIVILRVLHGARDIESLLFADKPS
jgi:toxin ParE1/3/4